ncbi:hypothetical protein RQP53_07570 [Paucibacter sp. APW11]|uniref:Uncharacterized protein n=1 Tax=Roseateles aquae TaxID=3077235 RepID=A0ABU3P971_9BURK|nr:hypothetical protein [Paucibacter sp. APW11]MDT8999123.1 hypothetical protein [Paucibacter sp. APW11]
MKMRLASMLCIGILALSTLPGCSTTEVAGKSEVAAAERDEGMLITGSRIPRKGKDAKIGVTVLDGESPNALSTMGRTVLNSGASTPGR